MTVFLFDIEGTTTSIAFVTDTLFPYARANVRPFLTENWEDDAVQRAVAQIRDEAEEAVNETPDALSDEVARQMDQDRKTTGLKSLQGLIWRAGYTDGTLKGHVYDEVPAALRRLRADGATLAIYSSGSINAQKLLFAHSRAGDLTPLLSAYFDTSSGPKREAASYINISETLGTPADNITFVTDVLAEAQAARHAGMRAVLSLRTGNTPLPLDHGFETIESFDEL
ncbi:MAG: enolase-phosphatase E1 [Bradymonadia bacterium]|jgi:enolase-phosphatase E1